MKVSLFITCLGDSLYPRVGEAMVKLLARYGIEVDFPQMQTCCGQPAFNAGHWDEARPAAQTLLHAFEHSDVVITPSGSCTSMIHHYYPKLFEHDAELLAKAQQLKAKTYEFTQFLVDIVGIDKVGAMFPHKVTYHTSCHGGRLMGIKEAPLALLDNVQGLQRVPLPYSEDCCGFGGTFSVKMAEIAGAMVAEKTDHIIETEAEVLTGIDMACLLNISGNLMHRGAPIRVMHVAELLAEGVLNSDAKR